MLSGPSCDCLFTLECIRETDVAANRFLTQVYWAVRLLWWGSVNRSPENCPHPEI